MSHQSDVFEVTRGLKVNWDKSNLFPIKEVTQIHQLANILGIRVGNMPTTYLGMPLGRKHTTQEIWDGQWRKQRKMQLGRKYNAYHLGLQVDLSIKFCLRFSSHLCDVTVSYIQICQKLDSLRRNFLWKRFKEGKGNYLVKRKTISLSKKKGGLGIRNPRLQGNSLLMKWLWSLEI